MKKALPDGFYNPLYDWLIKFPFFKSYLENCLMRYDSWNL